MTDIRMNLETFDFDLTESGTDDQYNVVTVNGAREMEQRILLALSAWKTEWELDRNFGVPWLQSILGRKFNSVRVITSILETYLTNLDNVTSVEIENVTYSPADRTLGLAKIRVTIDTTEVLELSDLQIP